MASSPPGTDRTVVSSLPSAESANAPQGWAVRERRLAAVGEAFISLQHPQNGRLVIRIRPPSEAAEGSALEEGGVFTTDDISGLSPAVATPLLPALQLALVDSSILADFPHFRPLPSPDAELSMLTFDSVGCRTLLEPEWMLNGPPRLGFTLQAIRQEGPNLALEFDGELPIRASLRRDTHPGFPLGDNLVLALERVGDLGVGDLPDGVALFCSRLAALLRERQAGRRLVESGLPIAEPPLGLIEPALTPPPTLDSSQPENAIRRRFSPLRTETPTGPALADGVLDLVAHLFALRASGYTILRRLLPLGQVESLRADLGCAIQATEQARAAGAAVPENELDDERYSAARCLYCWGDASLQLLEQDAIQQLSESTMGEHRLHEMLALSLRPVEQVDPARLEDWHRDVDVKADSPLFPQQLLFLVPLDGFRAENGATSVIPGSHRLWDLASPAPGSGRDRFLSKVQLQADPGDVIVLDPSVLYDVGWTQTGVPRRLVSIRVSHAAAPVFDHWAVAGQRVREKAKASPRLREILGGIEGNGLGGKDTQGLARLQVTLARFAAWPALPEDWQL